MDTDRISGAAKQAAGTVEKVAGDLTGDAKLQAEGRLRDVSGQAESLVGQAKDAARNVADAASDFAGQAVETGRRYIDEGRRRLPDSDDYYRDGRAAVVRQVEDSPIAALLVAGAVGYLLALLIHRR